MSKQLDIPEKHQKQGNHDIPEAITSHKHLLILLAKRSLLRAPPPIPYCGPGWAVIPRTLPIGTAVGM